MISSLFGNAIVALPAGIITAGYMNEIDNKKTNEQNKCKEFIDLYRYIIYGD